MPKDLSVLDWQAIVSEVSSEKSLYYLSSLELTQMRVDKVNVFSNEALQVLFTISQRACNYSEKVINKHLRNKPINIYRLRLPDSVAPEQSLTVVTE